LLSNILKQIKCKYDIEMEPSLPIHWDRLLDVQQGSKVKLGFMMWRNINVSCVRKPVCCEVSLNISFFCVKTNFHLSPILVTHTKQDQRHNVAEIGMFYKKVFVAMEVNMYLQNMNMYLQNISIKRAFSLFLCAAFLHVSFIMHIPISELHAQCQWWLHFSMSLNS
jgi:hypothetical protein